MSDNDLRAARSAIFALAATILCAQPCLAAEDYRDLQLRETRSAAFAGTALRLETGGRPKAATARLQIGMRTLSGGRNSAGDYRVNHVPALELAFGGEETGALLVAGTPTSEIKRRIGINGDTYTTASIIAAVALVAVGLLVISNLNSLDDGDSK